MNCRFYERVRGRVYVALMKGQHLDLYPDNAFILLLNDEKKKSNEQQQKKKSFGKCWNGM